MDLLQKKYWTRDNLKKRRHPSHPCVKDYVLPKIREIRKRISINSNTRLLDVGCGNGFFSYYFEQICFTVGIDFSRLMIKMCPIRKRFCEQADNIGFKDESFDIVFCHGLLHHTDNPLDIIKEMARVSRGYVVILEPNRNNPFMFLFSLLVKEERLALRYSLSYLRSMASLAGLIILDSFSYGMIIPNKSPKMILPLFRLFNFPFALGMTNFIIARKKT